MIHETTFAGSAGPKTPRVAIDWQVIYPAYPLTSAAFSGRVRLTSQMQKRAGLAQLQTQREILATKAKDLRGIRLHKRASAFDAELRRVTHDALRLEILNLEPSKC